MTAHKPKKPETVEELTKRAGKARMNGLTPEQRKELAKKAAAARWEKKPDE
jgi:hypothetical protein